MADTSLPPARSTIGEWTIDRYQRLLTGQLVVSPILLLAAAARFPKLLIVLAEIVWFIFLGWRLARRRGGRVESLVAGGLAGAATGLSAALGRWIANVDALWGLNVIAETLITAAAGALLTAATLTAARFIRYQR